MENIINKIYVRVFLILLSALAPFIYIAAEGIKYSISTYWETPMQPLFIFVNAFTSYFLFSMKNWWIPAFLLMLLTAFPVDGFYQLHNFFAISFFAFSGISIFRSRKERWCIIPYSFSLFPLLFGSIIFSEISSILVICVFHFSRIIRYSKISKERSDPRKES